MPIPENLKRKMTKEGVRMNIYVPKKLREKMVALRKKRRGHAFSWSRIAVRAFEEELEVEYTCMLLSTSYDEHGIPLVNAQMQKLGCGDKLKKLDPTWPMPLGSALWCVVVRKASQGQLLDALKTIKWSHPPVQVMFKSIDGIIWESFTVSEDPLLGG
jgi:hypothetical protein